MTPVALAEDIYKIVKIIHAQIVLMQTNRKRLLELGEKIDLIIGGIKGLTELPNTQQFMDALTELHSCLMQALTFIKKTKETPKIQLFFNARSDEGTIKDLKTKILHLLPLLQIGLSAQQLVDQEQDRRNAEEDHQALIQLIHSLQAEQRQIVPDLEKIMERKFASLLLNLRQESSGSSKQGFLAREFMVDFFELTFGEKLLSSETGDLYHGEWRNQPYTIKLVEHIDHEAARQDFFHEIEQMSRLHHDHVMPFYGACIEDQRLCFLTGEMSQGHLGQVLTNLSLQERLNIAKDLSKGLVYIHDQKLIHGDIRLEHVGIHRHQAKWMNVGLVKTQASQSNTLASQSILPDPRWQAPESWARSTPRSTELNAKSDIYSFGLLLWSLMTQRKPYDALAINDIRARVKGGYRETLSSDILIKDLIRACWAEQPERRPSAVEILKALNAIQLNPARSPSPTGEACYEQGIAAQKAGNLPQARTFFQRSSQKGYIKGITSFGLFQLQGLGGEPINKRAGFDALSRGAQGGHLRAQFDLARAYEKGDTPNNQPDYPKALHWYQQALRQDPNDAHAKKKVAALSEILSPNSAGYRLESGLG